jgi:hypothetical protein
MQFVNMRRCILAILVLLALGLFLFNRFGDESDETQERYVVGNLSEMNVEYLSGPMASNYNREGSRAMYGSRFKQNSGKNSYSIERFPQTLIGSPKRS